MSREPFATHRATDRKWESVEAIGQAFEEAWQTVDAPSLKSHLPAVTHPLHRLALVRLVAIDLDRQWRAARAVHLESYLESWPELRKLPEAIPELLAAECLSRAIYASMPDIQELRLRFPDCTATLDLSSIEKQALAARRYRSYLGSERFFLLRQLGKGGMGIVYAALDRHRNQVVALKALPETQPESLYSFKQEFRNLTEFVHPHLAAPYELLSIGGHWFFTMELIDGVDFITHVRGPRVRPASDLRAGFETTRSLVEGGMDTGVGGDRYPRGSEPEDCLIVGYERLRDLFRQLADALEALHRGGILHRDVKPSNVMVRRNGGLIVLDFGLSTPLSGQPANESRPARRLPESSSLSTERNRAGTAAYMSPEQAFGLPLTEVSDWYAVGAMMFLSLTGRLPFTGTPYEIADQKRLYDPPDPREFHRDIPDDLRQACLGLLAREPRDRWNGERLRQSIGSVSTASRQADAGALASPVPFVGRGEQLALLEQAYQETIAGATLCVHVFGQSGAGKSRLVNHFLRGSPSAQGAVILTGRCYESESVPFKGLDAIIDSLCRFLRSLPAAEAAALLPPEIDALARMFPVLSRVDAIAAAVESGRGLPDAQQLRRQAFAALRELLHRLGRRFPLIVAIDDLQWGDVDSAAVLAELLRPPDTPRLLLIVVYRSEHRGESACLDMLSTPRHGTNDAAIRRDVPVGPLSREESRQMTIRLLGDVDADERHAMTIARQAQGSPYFILEMVEHARQRVDLGDASTAIAALDLDTALQGRLQRLSREARRLLQVVAVAGRPLALRTVFEAARLSAADYGHVASLRSQHLLQTQGPGLDDPVSTGHDRIRESIVAHLAPQDLSALHGCLAGALERSKTADAEQVARHFDAAGQSERAGRYYATAAEQAARKLAFDRAARLYQRCLELLSLDESERRALLTKWGDALANAGRGLDAALRYETAAQGASGQEAFELRRRAAYQFCISGHVDQGRTALQALLASIGMALPGSPAWSLALLLANRCRLFLRGTSFTLCPSDRIDPDAVHRIDVIWTASAGLSMFDVVAGADFQTRGCVLALKTGEPFRLARALAWEAAHLSNLGGRTWTRAQRLLGDARRLADEVREPYARGWVALCEGVVNFTNGQWREARSHLERGEHTLRSDCMGVAWELDTAHAFTLWSLFYLGELPEMQRRAGRLVAEALERGDQYAATTHSTFCLPMSQLAAGEPETARNTIAAALGHWTQAGFHVQHFIALMCHTYVDLYCGQGEAAWRRMQEQWPLVARSQLLRVQVLRSLLTHLRARAALAFARASPSPGPLLRAARRDAQRVLREKMPYCTPQGRHLLAGVASLKGDRRRAIDLLQQAVQGYDETGMRVLAAATRCRLGELCGDDEGRRMIDDAYALLREAGVQDIERFITAAAVAVNPTPAKAPSRSSP